MDSYVPGYGASSARLMVVGEAPGKHEVDRGYPFAGPTGALLDEALEETPITRNDCYLTNVVKVRPPNNKIEDLHLIGHTIDEFMPQLYEELETINPNCILALGNTALTALTSFKGIEKYRGSIIQCSRTGQKVVPTMHPASLLHEGGTAGMKSWKEFSWIKFDVKRAYEQSLFREYRPPDRYLEVARNSLDVIRFLDRYSNKDKVTLDVETFKTYAQCIGLAFSSSHALSIPLFADDLSDINHIPSHDQGYIWKILAEFLADTKIKIIAQNAKFDEKRCRQLGLKWHDCWFDMAMGWHVLFPEFPKKLQFISSVLTEEPYYKDEGSDYNPKRDKIDRWFLYNAKDAAVEFECTEKILTALTEAGMYEWFFEKIAPLHRLYSDIEDAGMMVDFEVRKHLKQKYLALQIARQERLVTDIADGDPAIYEIYKNFNVMSNGPKNQVAKLIFGFLKCPIRKDTADDTLKALANNAIKDKRRKDIVLGVLEVRKLRKTIGTYIDAKPSADKRMHTQCNINGTETGRTSTGILQPPVSIEKEGIAAQTMTKHADAQLGGAGGADLRSMFIADPGFSFMEPDLSQAEDRVVCVLAKDWEALKFYDRTTFNYNKHGLKDDRHTVTAMAVCGVSFDGVTDYERQIGKKTRHAGNYDMGKHQHMLNLGRFGGVFISEWAAGKQIDAFHDNNPNIRGVYHAGIQDALREFSCRLVTPHGRQRTFYNKWSAELFKEAYAYIPQATVSDQVKFAMLRIKARMPEGTLYFLQESHDSFLALVRDDMIHIAAQVIKQEMEIPIDFSKCSLDREYLLVIPTDIKVGKRWVEKTEVFPDGMHKYKAV